MNCSEVQALLDALMDGELSEAQRQAMASHGQICPECAEAIQTTLRLKALFDEASPEADVPLEVQARWRGAVRQAAKDRGRARLRRWAAVAAAVVALVGVSVAVGLRGTPKRSAELMLAAEEIPMRSEPLALANGAAKGAVIETDGLEMAAYEEAPADAAVERAPACEFALKVADIDKACARIRDLAQEYEGVADVQPLGADGANVYVALTSQDAAEFLSAVAPLDESGGEIALPVLSGVGQVLLLLALHS